MGYIEFTSQRHERKTMIATVIDEVVGIPDIRCILAGKTNGSILTIHAS